MIWPLQVGGQQPPLDELDLLGEVDGVLLHRAQRAKLSIQPLLCSNFPCASVLLFKKTLVPRMKEISPCSTYTWLDNMLSRAIFGIILITRRKIAMIAMTLAE